MNFIPKIKENFIETLKNKKTLIENTFKITPKNSNHSHPNL